MSKCGNAVTCEGDAHETLVAQTQWDIDIGGRWAKQNLRFVKIYLHLVTVIDSWSSW